MPLQIFSIKMQGLFLSVLPKTQFPENAKTQFENAKTQFEKAKTQFGNCKTLKNRQFYSIHQNKFNSLNQFWCNQQKILLKPKFSYMSVMKTTLKMQNFNLSMPIIHLKIQKLNLTQQKLNLKKLKLKKRASTCASFPG